MRLLRPRLLMLLMGCHGLVRQRLVGHRLMDTGLMLHTGLLTGLGIPGTGRGRGALMLLAARRILRHRVP
ncbi:hypothetical protein H340_23973 [Streptomyces mobaraensis NBRC 13819 = DSM 40847]|uniref:Uncharacterized protein n=1 Tax=Streptomyces mobaraensis (strain ATCC 29032 / DSM 40847 / JCM 4168 / NBRC 13819 / NCIMB 11159 / IPCR 16-22) TaxID=1223523 RepID=M3C1X2_STRM1|nr:hypothetical protein H340_23973 [Streptomyces mobaraensis NBRC 13819 = DSM 40847]